SGPDHRPHPATLGRAPSTSGFPKVDVAGSTPVARSLCTLWERASRREFCEKQKCRCVVLTRPNLLSRAENTYPLPILLNTSPTSPLFSKRTNGSRVESCCHSYSVDSAICCAISLP